MFKSQKVVRDFLGQDMDINLYSKKRITSSVVMHIDFDKYPRVRKVNSSNCKLDNFILLFVHLVTLAWIRSSLPKLMPKTALLIRFTDF